MRWLQSFLNELVKEKIYKSTNVVLMFLSADDSAFAKQRKELGKVPGAKLLTEIPHFGGTAKVGVTPAKVEMSHKLAKYLNTSSTLYTKLHQTNDEVAKLSASLSSALSRQADLYRELAQSNVTIEVRI